MPTDAENQDQNQNTSTDGDKSGKVQFTPEQQARVQELIDQSFQKAFKKAEGKTQEAQQRVVALEQELAEAKKAAAKAPASKANESNDEVDRLRAELEETKRVKSQADSESKRLTQLVEEEKKRAEAARQDAMNTKKSSEISRAASRIGFIDLDDVLALTQNSIVWSDEFNQFVVQGPNSQPRLNNEFKPMSLDEFYNEFANTKKHLVRADFKFGSGSVEGQRSSASPTGQYKLEELFGKGSNSKKANQLAISNAPEYKRLKAMAAERGLI